MKYQANNDGIKDSDTVTPSSGVNDLVRALRESRTVLTGDIWERGVAADRLGELAKQDSSVLNYLLELSGSPEPLVRAGAARALLQPARVHPIAEVQLILLLDDCENWVSRRAAWSLLSIICDNCDVAVPTNEEEVKAILPSLWWTPVIHELYNVQLSLLYASQCHDPLVRMVASIGITPTNSLSC